MPYPVARTATFGLERLLEPVTVEAFVADHWDKAPLHVSGREREHYDAAFTLRDFDAALNHNSLCEPFIRMVKDGAPVPISGNSGRGRLPANHIEEVFTRHRAGATIVLQFLHEWQPQLKKLAASVSHGLTAATQINAYFTPARERGLKLHYDTHDVFVLQIAGRKRWNLFARTPVVPLRNELGLVEESDEPATSQSLTMSPGDCLYLPRGWLHRAAGLDECSLHLTLGVNPITWAQVLCKSITDAVLREPGLRNALPPGFTHDIAIGNRIRQDLDGRWRGLASKLTPELFMQEAVAATARTSRTQLEGHLVDLTRLGELAMETELEVRPISDLRVEHSVSRITLVFHGKSIELPEALASCIDFAMDRRRFRIGDLPDILTARDKIVFSRRLIQEGLLTFSSRD